MEHGINIAEAISQNPMVSLFNKQDKERSKICFFISHKDEDVEAAIEIGKHIMNDFGYNIYLDINDGDLQIADEEQDVEKIIFIIQNALLYASHLLCIVTEKSKESWWIPYEIGFAQANQVKTSSIKIKRSEYLPTFLRANNSPVFLNIRELDSYLSENGKYGKLLSTYRAVQDVGDKQYSYFDY